MKQTRSRSTRTRAITEEAKSRRRASILSAAAKLFATREFDVISVDDIASRAGLAKGTVYLYFGTKEALFLALVAVQLESWMNEAAPGLRKVKSSPAAAAAFVASTLNQRPALIRLIALLHAVLERNTEEAHLRDFKSRLLQITTQSGELFENVLGLAPGVGSRLTLWMHAMIVGLSQMTATSPTLSAVLAKDDSLAPLRLNFRAELQAALTTLFIGAKSDASTGRPPEV
jgi:AcrR family transcriptional regulator